MNKFWAYSLSGLDLEADFASIAEFVISSIEIEWLQRSRSEMAEKKIFDIQEYYQRRKNRKKSSGINSERRFYSVEELWTHRPL